MSGPPDGSSVRLKTVTWNGSVDVITLKLDQHYWPTYELRRTDDRLEAHADRLSARRRRAAYHARMVPDARRESSKPSTCCAAGELVAFPTETVYGLGADAQNPFAVRDLRAEGPPRDAPADRAHRASSRPLARWAAEVPPAAERLAEAFWPGPLRWCCRRRAPCRPR